MRIFAALMLITLTTSQVYGQDELPTIDLPAYDGLWFEFARTPNFFQDNTPVIEGERYSECFNATARYFIASSGFVNVRNRCVRDSLETENQLTDSITGLAQPLSGSNNAKLKLGLGPRFFAYILLASGFGADYWIYAVGPINNYGQYGWSIVSGPDRDYIFVLTRTQEISDQTRQEILTVAADAGLPVDELIFMQR